MEQIRPQVRQPKIRSFGIAARYWSVRIVGLHLWVLSFFGMQLPSLAAAVPDELRGIGVTEHRGAQVSIEDLHFTDETGRNVPLARYFHSSRPVLLTLVYYECPNLCNLLLNGLVETLQHFQWVPGKQFEIVAVSINPREGPPLASRKKQAYLRAYGRPETSAGWHFLTGSEDQIRSLAGEVGFRYRWDGQQYAHQTVSYVLTPEGRISRYLYGIDFRPTDLKMALLEASNGRIGTVIDRLLLFCYRYDPKTRKYSVYLTRLMQAGGVLTVFLLGSYLAVFWIRERRLDFKNTVEKGA